MRRWLLIAAFAPAWAACTGALEARVRAGAGDGADSAAKAAMPAPEAAATYLLGGLKAVLVDYLWVKSDLLLREGRYDELPQILGFVGALQPRNPAVAEYLAWHEAYNLSLAETGPDRGWFWVRSGVIRLESALEEFPCRPGTRVLLGRIFLEKCGEGGHPEYGRRLAEWKGAGNLELAAGQFELAVASEGHDAAADVFLAECYMRLIAGGKSPDAEDRLRNLLDHVRDRHPDLYSDLETLSGSRNLED